jgi:hypothetical protein
MPSPKDIKNLLKATQGTKAGKAMDLEELLGTLPKGTKAQQLEAELMFKRLQEEQAARYAGHTPPTEEGNAALSEAKKTLKKKQAPAVIIPSKISNVEKAIRESKGEFGAKRVQRAADEIKNLENLYTEEALRQAFGGDNAKAMMTMNPADFEEFAIPLVMQGMGYPGSAPSKVTLPTNEYINYLSGINEFHDIPFLQVNKGEQGLPLIPFISGHEGRHRSRAMAQRGEPAGLVQFLPRAELREPFPRRDQEEYLEALRKELEMTGNMVLPERYLDDGDVYIKRPAIELPDIYAEGGGVHMAGGGKALKALRGAGKAADATQDVQSIVNAGKPLTAAERAMVGKLAEQYTAEQPVTRMSEALGNVGAEGKNLRVTQTDRTSARNLGGAPFSMMQKVDPRYAQAKATWGVKTPGAAKNITNQSDADVVWSTLIGSPTQHRSNELIFDKLYKAFQKSAKEGNLNAELRAKFNAALEPIFGEGADILNPKLRKEIDTFEKRAVVGNLLLGEGLGGAQRGGSIIPGMKIMSETTEPMLRDVETFSIGPRLFTLDQGVITRPDLHPAFPEILQGEDLNQLFTPVPNKIALPTFNEDFMARTGRKKPGYYDLTMTPPGQPYPSQFVDEDYLNFLQKEGYADGGAVHMAGGGDAGDTSGEMFKPKPLTIPSPLTDMADAIRRQFNKERRSMRKPGASTDVLLRGPVAFAAGTPMDLIGMGGEALDYLQTKIPGLRTNASVMDEPRSVVDRRPPDTNYEPKFKFGPQPKVQSTLPFDANQYIQTNDPKLRAFINRRQKEINSSPQIPTVEDARMPYGTEDFQERLRRAGLTTDEERPLFELGSGIVAPFAASKALKYGKASAQALAPTAQDMLQMSLEKLSEPTRSYVIKPEGGNWVKGSVEGYLDPLKYEGSFAPENFPEYNQSGARSATAINNFVDKKLSKYMRNEMGTPSDSVRIQADEWANKKTQLLSDKQKQIDKAQADMEKAQQERNVNPEMLTRSQARIRELEKEKALIENRSGLHYEPPNAAFQAGLRRKNSKQLSSVEAKTDTGKKWEDVADASITGGEYRFQTPLIDNDLYIRGSSADRLKAEEDALREIGGEFAVQNPDAMVNKIDRGFANTGLGWDHLTDELENAMTRTSGLPENLLLDPKTVDKMSVPQAIEHVDKINAWRASQKTEADAARAANVATVVHKEYPEAGLKWVELKVPELIEQFKVPDRYEIKKPTPSSETFAIWDKEKAQYVTSGLGSEEAAAQHVQRMIGEDALQDALKYEGEMLSHCVGGYCPDVVSGKSRIFSLRDSAGKPYATIETNPNSVQTGLFNLDEVEKDALVQEVKDKYYGGVMPGVRDEEKFFDLVDKAYVQKYGNPPAKIKQIKGESNQAPKDDVLPYVQDFIKGEEWSEVGDLNNTGLFKVTKGQKLPGFSKEITPGYYTIDDFKRMAAENEMPQEILDSWMSKLERQSKYGFVYAAGGAVNMAAGGQLTFAKANQLLQQHVANMANGGAVRMAEGGAVDYESRFNEMLQKHVQGMAEGGEVNPYSEDPDMSDGGRFIQAPAFADGGAVKSIWTVN